MVLQFRFLAARKLPVK